MRTQVGHDLPKKNSALCTLRVLVKSKKKRGTKRGMKKTPQGLKDKKKKGKKEKRKKEEEVSPRL